ncbi:MAG: serine hydrolase [Bacteroidota bacterium]
MGILKKLLIGGALVLVATLCVAAYGVYHFNPSEHKVLDFIKDNPERASILLVRNDSVVAQQKINRVMPLASTVKIIIAIEYAVQAAEGKIEPKDLVALNEINKFYIPNTDGGAHPAWLNSVKAITVNGNVPIREIARGMIKYSSNANTEWLLNRLGLENVNNRLYALDVKNHTNIYHIVSALFVGKELFPDLSGEDLKDKLKALSMADYIEATNQIHGKLAADSSYKQDVGDLCMKIQKIWSDRLPASTVADYVSIMKKINRRDYFDEATKEYLKPVMEQIMENPANKSWLQHSGMKGGSTAFVLTKSLYATDKDGNTTEMAYFFNNLSTIEATILQMSLNDFELKVLTNQNFRNKIKSLLAE